LDEFFLTVNGAPTDNNAIQFLKKNFNCNSKGWITLQGFMELYLSQTAGGVEETFNDLKKLGFDSRLKMLDNRYSKT
jgi:hypothetical protein